MVGQKFGRWTVISKGDKTPSRCWKWLCRCDCGAQKEVDGTGLRSGRSKSCGCLQKEIAANVSKTITQHKLRGKFKEIIGSRYGRLMVVGYHRTGNCRQSYWNCKCDCGNMVTVRRSGLVTGRTTSCGCYQKESATKRISMLQLTHGKSKSVEYKAWLNMRMRCNYRTSQRYGNYGARGIKICDAWYDFSDFISDMGGCPPGHTLERIDVNGDYEPSNCRWATSYDQYRNKTTNRFVTINGVTKIITDWCADFNIKITTVYGRLRRGLDIVTALSTPVDNGGNS